MTELETIRVLLVEDDEDDYFLVKDLLKEIKGGVYELEWMKTYETGLATMMCNKHDVCLIDYRLGAHNGLELLRTALAGGCAAPLILLTGMGQHEVDVAAMKAGAADYLVKAKVDVYQLERAIRHAIERKRAAAQAAFDQARLAQFGARVGLALTQRASLTVILEQCAESMVQYLNCALAQIWVCDPTAQRTLEPRASAGPLLKTGSETSLPVINLNLEEIAQGKPLFIKSLVGDKRLNDQSWVVGENLTSFAAHPLMLEDRLVGLMSIYSHEMLTESVLQEMGSVANGIALCIQRKQAEDALDASEGRYRSVVENIKEIIFQMDEFGHWTFLNPAWTSITGFSVREGIGTFFLDYLHHDERERGRSIFLQMMNRKLNFCRYETRLLTKEG
jgi:FixJ family two-component response regulator